MWREIQGFKRSICLRRHRYGSGQSFVELAAGLALLVPIGLALFDFSVLMVASGVNDNVCNEAARAAASGRPANFTDSNGTVHNETALERAQGVVNRAGQNPHGYIQKIYLDPTTTGPVNLTVPDATYGGQYTGTFAVQTKSDVQMPASIPGLTPNIMTVMSKQAYPITFVEPATPPKPPGP